MALGNKVFGKDGKRIVDSLHHIIPASLTSVRMLFAWEAMHEHGVTLQGDVPGAYLGSPLSGPPTYLEIEPWHVPKHWAPKSGRRVGFPYPDCRVSLCVRTGVVSRTHKAKLVGIS